MYPKHSLRAHAIVAATLVSLSSGSELRAQPSAAQEAVYHRYLDFGSLVQGGKVMPNWMPDGSSFWYADGTPNDRKILKVDPKTNNVTPLFDVARLRTALERELGHAPAGSGVPFEGLAFLGPNRVSFSVEGRSYELDLTSYALTKQLPPGAFSIETVISEAERATPGTFQRETLTSLGRRPYPESMSPDARYIASAADYNLALRATVDGHKIQVTTDGTDQVFWDLDTALWYPWSPDGRTLVALKHDTVRLPRLPTIEWLQPVETVSFVPTIPAGGKLYKSTLHLVDMYSMQPVAVDLGDTTDQYVRILSWTPDSSELFIARYNRVMSKVELQAVNRLTRTVRTVLTESSKTFLTNHHEAVWGPETGFTLLPDGSGFIWNSERTGWDHLYHYDLKGKLVRQLTSGEWPVKDVVRVDQKGGWVYFTGHGDQARPYDTHVYRVGLNGKGYAQITDGKGQHSANFSPLAEYFVDTFSTVDVPAKSILRRADGSAIRTLGEADITRLKEVGWTAPREYVVKAADGTTDLWATMFLPYDFDPNRRYPVVEYIYGGPQTTMRPMSFGEDAGDFYRPGNFNRALANLGFVVVVLDARGTPERSKAFHDVVYMSWGKNEIADHAVALRQLGKQLSFMDMDRVGIMGGSWGGHFTFRALTQEPALYKAGISQVPGYDPYRFVLYEVYMGMPQENPAAYGVADVFPLASKLEGKLLLVGGINDTGTQADLFKMSETLIRLGKQHEMMVYPNSSHGAMGKTGEFDMDVKKNFFIRELMKPAAAQ